MSEIEVAPSEPKAAESAQHEPEDDFPWESLEVPSWVVLAVGLSIILIGVSAIWKALGG